MTRLNSFSSCMASVSSISCNLGKLDYRISIADFPSPDLDFLDFLDPSRWKLKMILFEKPFKNRSTMKINNPRLSAVFFFSRKWREIQIQMNSGIFLYHRRYLNILTKIIYSESFVFKKKRENICTGFGRISHGWSATINAREVNSTSFKRGRDKRVCAPRNFSKLEFYERKMFFLLFPFFTMPRCVKKSS